MGELVGECRDHDVERMAQHVDQRRLREQQRDQAKMGLVQRHLVGEARGPRPQDAHLAHLLQIIVAQIVQPVALIAHPQFGQRLGIAERACQHARHDCGDLVDQRQLVARGDPRMRRQRLLHQRRARTREAQDEDRLRHIRAHRRARDERAAAGGEEAAEPLDLLPPPPPRDRPAAGCSRASRLPSAKAAQASS